jgi:hypothetical protein
MPTSCPKIFLIPTVGIVLVLATFVGEGESAVAGNVPGISTASPVAVPVKIPEPSMLLGLGLVACSLVVTRRRVKD